MLDRQAKLIVKISNSGEKRVENNRLALKLNAQLKLMSDFSIDAGSSVYDTLNFVISQAGWNKGELSIQDYPITYDDNYFIAFNVIEKMKVLAIGESGSNVFLDALFKNQKEFNYSAITANNFNPSQLQGNQLVILTNLKNVSSSLAAAISGYLGDGGAVLVFPANPCEIESYNRFLNNFQANSLSGFSDQPQDLANINLQQNIFKDVFEVVPQNMSLPRALKYYTFTHSTASNEEALLTMKDGSNFLSRYPYKSGSLYVSASPLDKNYSELPVHDIFVPMMYNMSAMSLIGGYMIYYIGGKTRIEVDEPNPSDEKIYKIKGDKVEFIPEQFSVGNKILLGLSDQVKQAGFYRVAAEHSDSGQVLALNFDRRESDLRFFQSCSIKGQISCW